VLANTIFSRGDFVFGPEDWITVALLVFLEAILSADNAIVLALLAYGLPKAQQKLALKIGIWCAFIMRILAVSFLLEMLAFHWTKIAALALGGGYLCWLPAKHFRERSRTAGAGGGPRIAAAATLFGLSIFWSTVLRIEFTDIVFSVDSILVAMAASKNPVVIITGGILGIIAMRFVAGGFLRVIERFPNVVNGAYAIVGVAGAKMLVELAKEFGLVHIEDRLLKIVSMSLIVLIFAGSLVVGRSGDGGGPEEGEGPGKPA
jgi:YkoY family integral membrane protein